MGQDQSVSLKVIKAVARCVGAEPTTLEPPLASVIDPDALESLYRSGTAGPGDSNLTVEFTYNDCRVVVTESGDVSVRARGTNVGRNGTPQTRSPVK